MRISTPMPSSACCTKSIIARYPASEVDLLIRTGSEQRLSDFLLWECAYAELYFADCLWPDFDERRFRHALEDIRGASAALRRPRRRASARIARRARIVRMTSTIARALRRARPYSSHGARRLALLAARSRGGSGRTAAADPSVLRGHARNGMRVVIVPNSLAPWSRSR